MLSLLVGTGIGMVAGRIYGGVWPLGRSWWRNMRFEEPSGAAADEELPRDPYAGPPQELLQLQHR